MTTVIVALTVDDSCDEDVDDGDGACASYLTTVARLRAQTWMAESSITLAMVMMAIAVVTMVMRTYGGNNDG